MYAKIWVEMHDNFHIYVTLSTLGDAFQFRADVSKVKTMLENRPKIGLLFLCFVLAQFFLSMKLQGTSLF